MRLTKLRIEHFRSIKELEFEPGSPCVLIGENNAGKSNILCALNLLLEEWPTERSFSQISRITVHCVFQSQVVVVLSSGRP